MTKRSTQSDLQVVILAAGKGTRMRSDTPKVLFRLCGLTLIERTLRAVLALEPKRIVVVVGYQRELVEEELRLFQEREKPTSEIVVVEQVEQNGTGHAVQVALSGLSAGDSPILILPGDVPLLDQSVLSPLPAELEASSEPFLGVVTGFPENAIGYGRIVRDETGAVQSIVEHADCSVEQLEIGEINSSIYLSSYQFLKRALDGLSSQNAQGELYLTDIVSLASAEQLSVKAFIVEDFLTIEGANTRAELAELEMVRRQRINHQLMLQGVSLVDPESTYIEELVQVAADCRIGPGTQLLGRTVLEAGVVIDGASRIEDSQIGAGTHIKSSCAIEESQNVQSGCSIGPFAHLRPGTVLGEQVKLGNFVETKNSTIKQGAKVNHLSYVGDAEVGPQANVGAGTITCNYDGLRKSKTIIQEGAFIGSNTSLVAPVTIGKHAIIGAGSVITKDVSEGSLGLSRATQTSIEGYAERRKAKQRKS